MMLCDSADNRMQKEQSITLSNLAQRVDVRLCNMDSLAHD